MITNTEKKTLKTTIQGIGEVEIDILQLGNSFFLKEIEKFISNSSEKFYAITYFKPELKLPIHFQRALQAFVIHIQQGGEEQTAPLMRSHFRNWINKQNGSLKFIINGNQPNSNETNASLRDNVQAEFSRRFGNGQ